MGEARRGVLRNRADVRTLGFAACFFALVVVQLVWRPPLLGWGAPLWCATCLFAFIGAVSTHNVIHSPMFTRPWMNDAWRVVQTLWYGQPVSLFVPVHNHSHHKHAQTRKDLTRTTKVRHRWQLVNLLTGIQWQKAAARDSKAYFTEQARRGRKVARLFRVESVVLVVAYLALLAIDWKGALVYVIVPHQFGATCIRGINFLQHDGCAYDLDGYDHSRNFVGSWFNWLFLNNGYHTIHHMRPGLHWSVLADKHAELVAPHIHPALDVPDFGAWMWTHIVWPGERRRFDGAPWEDMPGGDGPDEPWSFELEELYTRQFGPREERRRKAS
ncbi:MAG: fatty acid desaturase [Alphaproteobacteria bacterium]|nr:fatty acid desaturase [Alphaproteobacteria bacterium]